MEGSDSGSIASEIRNGETRRLEFKLSLPGDPKKYLKTVVAFANTTGGRLLFGVADDGTIVGIPDSDIFKMKDSITNMIAESVSPLAGTDIFIISIEGKSIIVVDVQPGSETPYYYKPEGNQKGVYVRLNGVTKSAPDDMLRSLVIRGQRLSFDGLEYPKLRLDDKVIDSLCTRLSSSKQRIDRIKLINMGVIVEKADSDEATNAFALLTSNPFFQARIMCGAFSDSEGLVFRDSTELMGSIITQVDDALNFVLKNIRMGSEINGLYRKDMYEVPPEALREAIINAVVHRDYCLSGMSIFIRVLPEKVVIESPGLPLAWDYDDPSSGRSVIRNPVIASVFKSIGLIERFGTGISRMVSACKVQGSEPPAFEENHEFFRVVFSRSVPKVEDVPEVTTDYDNQTREDSIIRLIESNPYITQDEIATNLNLTPSIVRKCMVTMKSKGLITREGNRRSGKWVVIRN